MGPYCRCCGMRCFVPFPAGTPTEAIAAYRPGVTIIATCPGGQALEMEETGWSYARIHETLESTLGTREGLLDDLNKLDVYERGLLDTGQLFPA